MVRKKPIRKKVRIRNNKRLGYFFGKYKLPTDQKVIQRVNSLLIKLKSQKLFFIKLPQFKLRIFIIILFIIGTFGWFLITIFKDLPSAKSLSTRDISLSTKILDRNGRHLYTIYADQDRTYIPLSQIPLHLRQATIAMEDKSFYNHGGFALRGVIRALREITINQRLQGGSTITQQLVKSALLTPERTITRKIKELVLSFWAESIYSKDQILEMYLNQVPYGGTAWGVQAAAETYFGKSVSQLSLAESALLAGLPAAPTYYSPFGAYPDLAKKRQEEVLRRMKEDKYLSNKLEIKTKKIKLIYKKPASNIKAPHFVLFVKDQLVKKYGEKMVEKGGLRVYTTLDLSVQEMAEKIVAEEIVKMKQLKVGNGAALITHPPTGEIIALVGSKNYFDLKNDGNVNLVTSLRSPGSSIKPLNYALGFVKKIITPATVFLDIPICFPDSGGKKYCPGNYDGNFHGPVQVRFALGNSYNIPAVKILKLNGLPDFLKLAKEMGITTFSDPSRYGLSLTLGGGEVKMTDLAVAYGIFANGGYRKNLISINKILDKNGLIIEDANNPPLSQKISLLAFSGKRVLPMEVTYLISHILLDDYSRSQTFGARSLLNIPNHPEVSVKTGTTDDKRDNWTIGYNSQFLTAVWVGNNDNSPMSSYLESGGSGAAPIWHKIMTNILKNKESVWPKKPESVVGVEICYDGKLPDGDNCSGKRFEYFTKDTLPSEKTRSYKQKIYLDKNTGKPALPGQTENLEEKEVDLMSDPLQQNICINCPR